MAKVSRRTFSLSVASGIALSGLTAMGQEAKESAPKELKAGIIGLDTSHVMAFAKELNNPKAMEDVAHCRVVAAYPQGSADIESSASRIPGYTKSIQELGVEIVGSVEDLVKRVDCVLLETNDGRPHLEQALVAFKAGKPTFIDKPVAGSLADAVAIFQAAKKYNAPVFSCSSLRFAKGAQEIRNGAIGDVQGCDAYSPCSLEKTHPDLFWYGIHGVETLFTVMGPGCESVSRLSTPDCDLVAGVWNGGRIGTFRGIRSKGGTGYGGTAFGSKGIREIGKFDGYRPLAVEIVKFFRGGPAPISAEETIQIYAFMEAADESKRQGGKPVSIDAVMKKAEVEAASRLAALGVK
ncbi:Oxidoreductase family, NAD-binding Rossmann fold [Anatilimnocola aggregata]|uniref:Oxidoreductase family, NAD-binding Rossmann fold n=1 Tax=Anatilimnocola aggregata TaxID=2528021 RepID=A0A517YCL1_9BACT|nr:Gfo/Idh/MocA family oxidoreductase [Anatilimnocola aggregata]QDU27977.1 Oxidoreductase family, NAD-binding Rossmann fold [Anatilimnocola aggregata]